MCTRNLCIEQKYEKCQNFYLKTQFLVVKFSIYLNRCVFCNMLGLQISSFTAGRFSSAFLLV